METLLSIQDKIFYVNYKGAIRQAKFDRAICLPNGMCGGKATIETLWKVAGISEPKKYYELDYNIYYSAKDAEDEKNEIKLESLTHETVNKYSDNFRVEENGYPYAYVWNGAKPVSVSLIYEMRNVRSEFKDGKFVLMYDALNCGTGKKLKPFYKTAEECKAHYRPQIITF